MGIVQGENTLPHSGNGESNPLPGVIPKKVHTILWEPEIIHNDFYSKNIIVSDRHGVCIQFHFDEVWFYFQSFQMQLRVCIDTIYTDGIYFDQLDIKKLECVLYGTQEEVLMQLDPTHGGIRICAAVKKLSELEQRSLNTIYTGKLQIKNDGMEVTLQAGSLTQIERMLGENYASHELFILRSDLFHAYLWAYGIKYHGTSLFLERIESKRRDELDTILQSLKWVIATWKKPTETRDDTLRNYEIFEEGKLNNPTMQIANPYPPLKIRRKPLIINGKPAEGWEVECIFPKAKSGQVILEIIAGKIWNTGINIQWQILPYKEIKKVTLNSVLDTSSMELIQIDTDSDSIKTTIIAKEDIYLSLDKQGRLIASRYKKYTGTIWAKTGSLSLPQDGTTFVLQGDIEWWYHIRGYDIVYSGELHGKIFAQNQVTVRSGGIVWGTIISDHGNITIEKWTRVQDGTRLIATNGTITIHWDLNHATIIGSGIKIHGRATKCTLIGWNVEIWENNGSKVLSESFSIDSDIDGNAEYTVLVYAGIQWLISASLEKMSEAESRWEIEKYRISELSKKIAGEEILTRGKIHPDSRLEIMVIPFLLRMELWEFLKVNNYPDLLKSKRSHGLQDILSLDQRKQWVFCPMNDFPLSRTSAITILESKLSNQVDRRDIPRDPLFVRWLRLKASVGQLSGHIFDYSDSGASFILVNSDPTTSWLIMKETTIDVTILGHQLISFFVTRIENRLVKWVNYTFIAGAYITQWMGIEISKAVAIIDTQWNWSK